MDPLRSAVTSAVYDLEAESALIGALLINNTIIPDAVELLGEDYLVFFKKEHQVLYWGILELFKRGQTAVDAIVLYDFLKQQPITVYDRTAKSDGNVADICGGFEFIRAVFEQSSELINYEEYIRIVKNKSLLRRLLNVLSGIYQETLQSTADIEMLLEQAERKIFDVVHERSVTSFVKLPSIIHEQVSYIEEIKQHGRSKDAIITGYRDLDSIIGGFRPGQLIVLAARPSVGKTAFALNIARNVAMESDKAVAVFSLEMSKDELGQRFIFMEAGVKGNQVMQGFISQAQLASIHDAGQRLDNLPIFIDDSAGTTPLQIRAKMRRLLSRADSDIKLVIIDYLQLMNIKEFTASMNERVTIISRSLKEIAKEFKVPVIALSQLSRAVEQRESKKPQLSDLRESGAIEQDADMVMFLYREAYYNKEKADDNTTDVILAKNRNGPTGEVKLFFERDCGRFKSFSFEKD